MKPFSLEAVLKYRKQREDKAATKLANALRSFQLSKSKLSSAVHEHSVLCTNLNSHQKIGMDVQEFIRYQNRLEWLNNHIAQLKEELQTKQREVNSTRKEVIARSRDRKVMEQLKDRQNKEYRDYLEKKETRQLDEIAVLSHDRKRQGQN